MGRLVGFAFVVIAFGLIISACSGGGTTPTPVNYSGEPVSDFVAAIEARDSDKVRQLLATDPSLIELRDESGRSPMHYAALNDGAEIIALLVDAGIDPNVRDNEGMTALSVLEDSGLRYDATRKALLDNGGTN